MTLPVFTFTSLVQTCVATTQAACSSLTNFAIGSANRAIMDAASTVALWIQWLVMQVLLSIRAATSVGPVLDTWLADFTFSRLPGIAATGVETLSRYTAGPPLLISPGGQVKTADGTQTFNIVADPNNVTGNWNAGSAAYSMGAGIASIAVLIQAANAGTQGNVVAGAVSVLATAIPGIDYVSNAAATSGGLNEESDAAARARFQLWVNSRSLGTVLAVETAALSVQQGVTVLVEENTPSLGFFTVIVDDGTGSPPSSLLSAIQTAVNAVRPIGSMVYVVPPTVIDASITIILNTLGGLAQHNALTSTVDLAVSSYANSLPVGASLTIFNLSGIVKAQDPVNIVGASIEINGMVADLNVLPTQVIKAPSVSVS